MKGATTLVVLRKDMLHDFNPRTHEGCDIWQPVQQCMSAVISIHAPMKGATYFDSKKSVVDMLISIHAPMKGATLPALLST